MALTEAITPAVTTGHVGDHIELHDYWNGLGHVFNITHRDYGAVAAPGNEATNIAALNDAIADAAAAVAGTDDIAHVVGPAGRDFPVDLDQVNGASNVQIGGGFTLSTTQTTAGAFVTFPAGSENFGVDSVVFKSPNDRAVGVQVMSSASAMSDDFDITNNRCIEARLVQTNDLTITYASHSTHLTTGTVTRNARIAGNRGKRTSANLTNLAFILIWYTVGGEIANNRIKGYGYGIQWWGGDADVATDGALANERKCGDLTITGNRVHDMLDALGGGGGIWGSMGRDITVTGNLVENCADVGIDCEGGDTVTISGNTVNNGANSCLATFFHNRSVVFSGNVCRQDTTGALIARIQNNYSTTDNRDVTFEGNILTGPTGVVVFFIETIQRAIVRNNTLRNVRIDSQVNNQRNTTITDNDLLFDVVAGASFNAINVGWNNLGGRVVIRGNTVETLVSQPAGSLALRSDQFDPTTRVLEVIEDNTLLGFPLAIETIWDGANAGIGCTTLIRRNTVSVGATIVNTRGANSLATGVAATVVREGNRDLNGSAVA